MFWCSCGGNLEYVVEGRYDQDAFYTVWMFYLFFSVLQKLSLLWTSINDESNSVQIFV